MTGVMGILLMAGRLPGCFRQSILDPPVSGGMIFISTWTVLPVVSVRTSQAGFIMVVIMGIFW
ncbi:hypothetical protein [Komagataeibacter swingsii]|uniref:Uncharacterized protein n=1 Tax=Komagataeibacter swingsii TaxID=215220 RepID=A0A850P8G3_9PROT|nr:hypothetical protein [Komagataeibacter swingsii]NVN38596.1 hypothetical protein [Komagataeibacter swingsii]